MRSYFEGNPAFWPQVLDAVADAVTDAGEQMAEETQRNAVHGREVKVETKLDAEGPAVVVRREGLGKIFEKGTKDRFTRSGAGRGRIEPGDLALTRARDTVLSRGINLARYL